MDCAIRSLVYCLAIYDCITFLHLCNNAIIVIALIKTLTNRNWKMLNSMESFIFNGEKVDSRF